jgi:hypothetical protein
MKLLNSFFRDFGHIPREDRGEMNDFATAMLRRLAGASIYHLHSSAFEFMKLPSIRTPFRVATP